MKNDYWRIRDLEGENQIFFCNSCYFCFKSLLLKNTNNLASKPPGNLPLNWLYNISIILFTSYGV